MNNELEELDGAMKTLEPSSSSIGGRTDLGFYLLNASSRLAVLRTELQICSVHFTTFGLAFFGLALLAWVAGFYWLPVAMTVMSLATLTSSCVLHMTGFHIGTKLDIIQKSMSELYFPHIADRAARKAEK